MKKIFWIALSIAVLLATACKKDNNEEPPAPAPSFKLSATTVEFAATPTDNKTVAITANVEWTATKSAGAEWLTLSPAAGSGNGTLTLSAAPNTTFTANTATISIKPTGMDAQTLSVTQAGIVASRHTDSLALVALYNATGGANWTGKWTLTNPMSAWTGVTLTAGRVTSLSLYDNNLSGAIPAELGNLTNLTLLSFYFNRLSGPIPVELGGLTNLNLLDLGSNHLSGTIPAELGNLKNLTKLDLYDNQLSGAIPATLVGLTKLTALNLHYNQLSGAIPAQLGSLTNLTWIYLHENQLSGAIPAELGNLTKLNRLALHNNQLSGDIPATLGGLTKLQYVWIEHNALSGALPASFLNATDGKTFCPQYTAANKTTVNTNPWSNFTCP